MRPLKLAALVFALLALAACGKKKKKQKKPTPKAVPAAFPTAGAANASERGLSFRLETGQAISSPRPTVAVGTPLTAGTANALLGRMGPLPQTKDAKSFAFRKRTLPPPRTGKTITAVFPPPVQLKPANVGNQGALKVLRATPKDDVNIAPKLSVTFSQPMVAVTSHADSIATGVPVTLSPPLKGVWRWIGTRTLLFESKVRLPMATQFDAEVPAGTKSALGNALPEAYKWSFRTPAPRLIDQYPTYGPHPLNPVIFIGFDQKIDTKAVMATVRLKAGQTDVAIRLATEKEIKADKHVAPKVRAWRRGPAKHRFVAFVAEAPLQPNTGYTVEVGPGTPSAEGPRKTDKAQTFTFRTYAPLKVNSTNCTERYKCVPLSVLYLSFNNPLDVDKLPRQGITVSPPIDNMRITASHRTLRIFGRTKGRRTYTVTLPASIRDEYGQTLGQGEKRQFHFKGATPSLFTQHKDHYVTDPRGEKAYTVHSVNYKQLKVKIWKVAPTDWSQYQDYKRTQNRARWRKLEPTKLVPHPGQLVMDKVIAVKHVQDELVQTALPLKPALDKAGHGQVSIEVTQWPPPEKRYQRIYLRAWIQATDIAVDALSDYTDALTWVTSLADGKPVAGATVSLAGDGVSGTTDPQGLAKLSLPSGTKTNRLLVARKGGDLVFLLDSRWGWSRNWRRRSPPGEVMRWFVFDDRKLYKPKETVRVKGFVRVVNTGVKNGIRLLEEGQRKLTYEVKGPRGNKVAKGTAVVGEMGGFDFEFKLPDNVNLGQGRVIIASNAGIIGNRHYHSFKIQEFKRPEFEVSSNASAGPHMIASHADVSVTGRYFSGGPLPGAPVKWRVTATQGYFSPPKVKPGFTWSGHVPAWAQSDKSKKQRPTWFPSHTKSFDGQTDGKGTHRLRIHFDRVDPPMASSVNAVATLTDVNRQTWTASKALVVHPAKVYVGLKTKKYYYRKGEKIKMQVLVANLDGQSVAGRPVDVVAWRRKWEVKRWKWKAIRVDRQHCRVKSDTGPVTCTFHTKKGGGQYAFIAMTTDADGKRNMSAMSRWVSGGRVKQERRVKLEQAKLLLDKTAGYKPGETAEVLVQSPFYPAEGLMTIRREGLLRKERFTMTGPTHTLKVPLTEAHMPNLHVAVNLVGSAPRLDAQGDPHPKLPHRPAYASAQANISVSYKKYQLDLQVQPRQKAVLPGGKTVIDVVLRDQDKKPMAGEVALVVVDEAVLALTGYRVGNPLGYFYPYRSSGVRERHLRGLVALMDPAALEKLLETKAVNQSPRPRYKNGGKRYRKRRAKRRSSGAGFGRGGGSTGGLLGGLSPASPKPAPSVASTPAPGAAKEKAKRPTKKAETTSSADRDNGATGKKDTKIAVRKNFSALALFAPKVKVGPDGKAQVPIKLPDSLTRYRIMAVAVSGKNYYGRGDDTLTARKALMIRPALPRFLNFGDKFAFPVVVQNQTDEPLTVKLAVRGNNIKWIGSRAQQVTIPANDRREARFQAETVSAGKARFQIAASTTVGGQEVTDGAEVTLPVWTPATTEAFATYGTIDKGGEIQPVQMPKDVVKQFGGLEIGTSSTALHALTDAVLYLYRYPYECSEQTASRVLSVAALRDVLGAFKAKGFPGTKAIAAAMARDLRRLQSMQNYDGGWGFWVHGQRSWPFLSIHVTHALARAKAKGYTIPARMWNHALRFIRHIERHIPSTYPERIRQVIIAYSLYARQVAGELDVAKAKKTYANLGGAKTGPLEAIAWLYPVLSGQADGKTEIAEIRKALQNRVTETAAGAHFSTSYTDGGHLILHSNRRVDGVLLEALIKDQPKSDLIVKIVRGLLAHRKRGRWSNTQENVFILLALDRYFNTYEKATPNFVAQVWLGARYAGQHAFRGRTTERHQIDIPMAMLGTPGQKQNLVVAKKGPGRLYYRIGMRYAPADLRPPPADHGFVVRRRYEALDNPSDVKRQKDGTWRVKAGARVRVVVTMVAQTRRYHVALVDPLPAGFEPLNPALRGGEPMPTPNKLAMLKSLLGGLTRGRSARRIARRAFRRFRHGWWRRSWYEHENLRDERAEAFTSLLWGGVHTYKYIARATTPGTFVVPPPKAEEMYHPETFGRGPGDKVVVHD